MKQNFKALQAKWYKKLAKSGFEDIEDSKGRLLKWSTTAGTLHTSSKEEYYRLANQYLHEYEFKVALDEKVWTLHAQGLTVWEVARKVKRSHSTTQRIIERIRAEFGLVRYDKDDTN